MHLGSDDKPQKISQQAHKILLIEDDPVLKEMYLERMKMEGFIVDSARDGNEGLDKMRSFLPDLVLLDLIMPELSGFEALEIAKKDPSIAHIPIIVLSNIRAEVEDLMKKGAARFILKSDSTPSQVIEEIKETLSKKSN